MLTKKQIGEIKKHLDKAQNPLFFFDNDSDGLCAFLILQKFSGKGKGIPIRSFPELTAEYFRKIRELNADYIFILDKPIVSKEFLEEVAQNNIPIVWIDHHAIEKKDIPKFVNYYNPLYNKTKNPLPTTYLCYQISRRKEDLWLGVVGSISDKFVPEFYGEFKKEYPDLAFDSDDAFDIIYKSQIGKIVKIFSFALKDRTTNVTNMLKFLMKAKTPYEVLEESKGNYTMHKRYNEINSKYKKLIEKAKNNFNEKEKILFFKYGGDLSISSDLSNELSCRFPGKYVVVAYLSGIKANISARGEKVRDIVLNSIKNLKDSRGGGHENAVGAQVKVEDLDAFAENMEIEINKHNIYK